MNKLGQKMVKKVDIVGLIEKKKIYVVKMSLKQEATKQEKKLWSTFRSFFYQAL